MEFNDIFINCRHACQHSSGLNLFAVGAAVIVTIGRFSALLTQFINLMA